VGDEFSFKEDDVAGVKFTDVRFFFLVDWFEDFDFEEGDCFGIIFV
jgi:hypothetical protein